jgi:phospholipid-transporting ATPase
MSLILMNFLIFFQHLCPFYDASLSRDLESKENQPLSEMIDNFLTCLAVCHSVLPDFKDPNGIRYSVTADALEDFSKVDLEYQASSPDERALALGAANMNYFFCRRKSSMVSCGKLNLDGQIVSVIINGKRVDFTLFLLVEFTSARKRMTVVVLDPRDKKVKVFCKGADDIIRERLSPESFERDWAETQDTLTVRCYNIFTLISHAN